MSPMSIVSMPLDRSSARTIDRRILADVELVDVVAALDVDVLGLDGDNGPLNLADGDFGSLAHDRLRFGLGVIKARALVVCLGDGSHQSRLAGRIVRVDCASDRPRLDERIGGERLAHVFELDVFALGPNRIDLDLRFGRVRRFGRSLESTLDGPFVAVDFRDEDQLLVDAEAEAGFRGKAFGGDDLGRVETPGERFGQRGAGQEPRLRALSSNSKPSATIVSLSGPDVLGPSTLMLAMRCKSAIRWNSWRNVVSCSKVPSPVTLTLMLFQPGPVPVRCSGVTCN